MESDVKIKLKLKEGLDLELSFAEAFRLLLQLEEKIKNPDMITTTPLDMDAELIPDSKMPEV